MAEQKYTKVDLLRPHKQLHVVPAADKQALFIDKLRLCSVQCTWHDDTDERVREAKRAILLELVDYIGKNKNIYTPEVLQEIVKMVSANLFRALPPSASVGQAISGESAEEEPVLEPSWSHLQIVYEFFLRFIVSQDVDIRMLKKYINGYFLLRLLELFDSEDTRERDYLKTILHRIYAKFMTLRAFIRKAINNVFYTFIYETGRHNGIAELLEILGSIINGFALPLKAEHKRFLLHVLCPMHKVKSLSNFHQQLSYCVTQFVDKDPTLATPVISACLQCWPVTNSQKEVLFLGELEELLELTQQDEFAQVMKPLFTQLNRSIGSQHFQIAERALFLWHNEHISQLIVENRKEILPLIYPILAENSENHWNPTVKTLTFGVMKVFSEVDEALYEQVKSAADVSKAGIETVKRQRAEAWSHLESVHRADESKAAEKF